MSERRRVEKWEAYYQCKACQSQWMRDDNVRSEQKRQCPACRKLNTPYGEVSFIIY